MAPDLPGFYFDAEKNRYFKIQPNHVAPSESKYSRQAVKAERVIKKAQRRIESSQRTKISTTVTRSKVLQHPLLSFERRLGHLGKSATSFVADYYAASLHGADAFGGLHSHKPTTTGGYQSDRQYRISPESGQFALDNQSGTLFGDFAWQAVTFHVPRYRGSSMHAFHRQEETVSNEFYPPDNGGVLFSPKVGPLDTICHVTRVEHINATGSGLVLWTQGCLPSQSPQISVVKVGACSIGPYSNRHDVVDELAFQSRVQDTTVQSSSTMVVVATSRSLWLMDTSDWRYSLAKYPLGDTTNDLMKINFKDHNILMGGTRSGKVLLFDIREPPSEKGGRSSATRIQHSSAINALNALPDGHTILISGLTSMSLYDLRYTPSPTLKCHLPRSNAYRNSPTVLDFNIPETRTQNQYGLGFAYEPELNVLVRASTDYVKNHRVGLWDVRTGRLMRSPLNEHRFEQPVVCAQIARVRDGPKSILLSDGARIWEWAAQGRKADSTMEDG